MFITGKYLGVLYQNAMEDKEEEEDLPPLPDFDNANDVMILDIPRDALWQLFRFSLRELPGDDAWENDCLWLALNWNQCYSDGKHPTTTEHEWDVLNNIMTSATDPYYIEETCKVLFDRLCQERLRLAIELFFHEDFA